MLLKNAKDTGNPNGKPNSDVVKRRLGGQDVTETQGILWIIDLAFDMLWKKPQSMICPSSMFI